MSKNRDSLGIVAAILEAANSGSPKTRIMFDANNPGHAIAYSFGRLSMGNWIFAPFSGSVRADNMTELARPVFEAHSHHQIQCHALMTSLHIQKDPVCLSSLEKRFCVSSSFGFAILMEDD